MVKKKNYKWILISIGIAFGTVICIAWYFFSKAPDDIAKVSPDIRLHAADLSQAYSSNEDEANRLYLGKVVEVAGRIAEVSEEANAVPYIRLYAPDSEAPSINFLLDTRHAPALEKLNAGDSITLRGVCNGFLIDVECNRAVIVTKK